MTTISSATSNHSAKKTTGITGFILGNQRATQAWANYWPYRQKFEMASKFADSLKEVLTITDRNQHSSLFIWYHAIRHILQYAFIGDQSGINYEKVLISRGGLWNTNKAQAKAGAGTVTFNWDNNSGTGGAKPNDQCILVAYCEALNQCAFSTATERQSAEGILAVPDFAGHPVHTWLGFISADGKRVANSVYTGTVTIT